ncbi:hypothetical protein [Streptomyces sp. NPDC096033]|uniref:hypothetical protein n=1 Tax=Streptomyces sp. NPDC096033 TaxID=3366071 RepID=UPI003811F19A
MTSLIEPGLIRCTAVVMSHRLLEPFLEAARSAYEECTPSEPPSCFAVLVGSVQGESAMVRRVELARSVRSTDEVAAAEFRETIVPLFGAAYENIHRGFWCDSKDLLRIQRSAEADGWDIIGSVHLHPDWHRIGPPAERGLRISERPTPMDCYMFGSTGWPVNMICYLKRGGGRLQHRLGAWGLPAGLQDTDCPPLDIRLGTGGQERAA